MPNQPRKHHYVPQFYLAGFTDNGTVEGSLSVLDTNRLKVWKGKPKDVAHQRDFHQIDGGPNGDPMVIEKLFGQFEGKWSSVLRGVIEQQQLPDDDRFGDLMMFVAFMAVRVPRIRNTITSFLDEVRQKEEFARNWLQQQGEQVESAFKKEADEFDQTWHVRQMVQMAVTLAPILSLRTWQLWIVNSAAPDLFCSDSPVALTWATAVTGPYPPGFELKNTVVSVPLHKRLAMVGMFDIDVRRRTIGVSEVAQLNSATGMHAGQLYSATPDFVWFMKDGTIGGPGELLDALKVSGS
ncbi:MAG: DUF4238 domain-containing protein [Planctomycetaceae bacterium]|nr:DUF4238 domain-containing protein [Planctomycetaceae bacterium]